MATVEPRVGGETTQVVGIERRKPLMERVIETVASSLGNGVGWLAETGVLFVIFAVIWLAFGAGLIWSQGSVDAAWRAIRELPLLVQVVAWVLLLPVMIGLWVWETSWPVLVRVLLVIGIAGWNLLVFLPKGLQGKA